MEQPDWRDLAIAKLRLENKALGKRVRELETWLAPHIDLEKWSQDVHEDSH